MAADSPEKTNSDSAPETQSRGRRGGLGRGLGSLIPTYSDTETSAPTLEVDIDAIVANPYQPRSSFDPAKLQSLAESIRLHGVIQPLVVKSTDERDRYILIAGERRWRAARIAGLRTLPVVRMDVAPQAMLELALVENVVRADLSPLEEAAAYRQLIDEFGLTQANVAERVGRSRVSVTNTLRLLSAPEQVQFALQSGQITEGHARALLGLPTAADQVAMLETAIERDWTVRQTEDGVRRWLSEPSRVSTEAPQRNTHLLSVEDRFQRALGTRVSVRQQAGTSSGTVVIHYYSDEQLQAIYDRVAGEDLT